MPEPKIPTLSRRDFATSAFLAAAATLAATNPATLAAQSATPPLSSSSQSESAQRLQTILALYGPRFSESQKSDLQKVCDSTQSTLDHLRDYKTENSDDPALHLKPLMEHEKKPILPILGNPAQAAPKP